MMESVMNRVRKMKMLDMAIFKVYLFFLGLLVGAYFTTFITEYSVVIAVVAGLSMIHVIYTFFIKKVDSE